jgi:TRAP transporter 4TM/12TM fusion protein
MMLEIVDPPVTYLQIIRAALIPALLYYSSLLLIVHLYARRIGAKPEDESVDLPTPGLQTGGPAGGILFGLAFVVLVILLLLGYTPFRAVTGSLLAVWLIGLLKPETRLGPGELIKAAVRTLESGKPLVAASCCVGIIIGVVTLTGVGARLPGTLLPLAQDNLLLALLLLMVSSIILGMGLPSSVCYLLLATLVGPVLGELGPPPLAAHFFIFYFGMMSMVTPPVALAAYTASAIAGSRITPTAFAAFRFSLVGFALPFAFVLNPELLLLDGLGTGTGKLLFVIVQTALATLPVAAGIAGYGFAPLALGERILLVVAGLSILILPYARVTSIIQGIACGLILVVAIANLRTSRTPLSQV